MKHLYVCRHGESVLNSLDTYAGWTDTPLTELGRDQANQAGVSAEKLHIDYIVSSPLVRALETAQIIAAVIGYPLGQIQTDKLFMERGLGKLSGQPFSTFPDPGIYTDIEPETNVIARAQAALEILRNIEADCILVVSHGTFLLTLQKLIDPSTPDEELPNAEIVELAL